MIKLLVFKKRNVPIHATNLFQFKYRKYYFQTSLRGKNCKISIGILMQMLTNS